MFFIIFFKKAKKKPTTPKQNINKCISSMEQFVLLYGTSFLKGTGKNAQKILSSDTMVFNCPVLCFEVQTRKVYAFRDDNKGALL